MTNLRTFSESLPPLIIPPADRPQMPAGYGVPSTRKGMLSWEWVSEHMKNAPLYWIGTVHPGNRPHLMPNWGAWVDDRFFFSTDPSTRKGRNLEGNAHISVGIQDEQHTIIIEGVTARATDRALLSRIADEYERKYGMREGEEGVYVVLPLKVIALADFPNTPTRWVFETT